MTERTSGSVDAAIAATAQTLREYAGGLRDRAERAESECDELRGRLATAEEEAAGDARAIAGYRDALTAMQGERDEARAELAGRSEATETYLSAIATLSAALRRLADPEWPSSGRDIGFGGEMEARRALARKALDDVDHLRPASEPELPKTLGHPDDAAEEWLAETYEPDDANAVGYGRSEMIDAYHAGWDKARERIAKFGRDENGRWRTLEPQHAPELAAAMSEARRVRDVVCKLIGLFSAPDGRRMQHASVTAATIERYAAEAGVKP